MSKKEILNNKEFNKKINVLVEEILHDFSNFDNFAIVGIQTRGPELADRIRKKLELKTDKKIKNGVLDVSFHRDDIATRGVLPEIKETRIDFDIDKMTILLVDDVLFTGRTTKAALEALTSFGRPELIKLLVLIDRGGREIPIQADYCGLKIKTDVLDKVKVRIKEHDGVEDCAFILGSA